MSTLVQSSNLPATALHRPAADAQLPSTPIVAEAPRTAPGPWYRAGLPRRPWVWVWLAGVVIAMGWDRAVWLFVARFTMPLTEAIEATAFRQAVSGLFSWRLADVAGTAAYWLYHAVKMFGSMWFAAALAAIIVVRSAAQPDSGRARVAIRRGVLLFLCAGSAGLLAEGLKLVFRRQRPELADGWFSFRFHDWLNASGLGLPSSHAAVAVGAAAAMCVLYPARRWVWITLAALCSLSRVLAGAHFASDVLLGILVGLIAARAIIALDLRNNHNAPVPMA